MALTEYDKKNLSASDQKKIQAATDKWNAANAKGDKAGMAAAQAEAAAVRNKAGYTTNSDGTYKSTISSGSSGGSSKSSSGGGSSNKNSQYSKPTLGNTWDANTDYQAIINSAVANGDYVTAAKAEQLRNQKITATGGNYNTTNMYAGHLDNKDYGTIGQQQMANGASWQDVQATLDGRIDKAMNTVGLERYAYDDVAWMMYNYIQDQKNAEIKQEYEDMIAELNEERPEEYQSKYDPQIDAILNEILNRDDFSYDAMNDPLYQQYAKMYQREGDRAMKETMAEAAASAGGMNTYAITAAQQANSYYGSQLNDKIPQLYQLAYEMYLNEKESKVQDLGILQNMDATQYNRYRDTINDFYNDRNFAYGAYQDAVQQGNWQSNFDYNAMLDKQNFNNNEYWKNKEWDAERGDIEYERGQYDQETAKAEVWKLIEMGVTPSAELIAKSGMSESDVNLAVAAVKAEQANKNKSSSGGGGYTGDDKKKVTEDEKKEDEGYTPKVEDEGNEPVESVGIGNGVSSSSVINLGIGPINNETLLKLAKSGAVTLNADGTAQWANGFGPHNYEKILSAYDKRIFPTLTF